MSDLSSTNDQLNEIRSACQSRPRRSAWRIAGGVLAAGLGLAGAFAAAAPVGANVPTPTTAPGAAGPYGTTWYSGAPNLAPFGYGNPGDIPLYGDMDGDGKDDPVVYRPTTQRFYWRLNPAGVAFGNPGDSPMLGDTDGDGKANLVVYRPSTQQFFFGTQSGVEQSRFQFGNPGDLPILGTFHGGRIAEPGLYRPSNRVFYLGRNPNGTATYSSPSWGNAGDIPLATKLGGFGHIALYRPSTQQFFSGLDAAGNTLFMQSFGNPGDTPLTGDTNGDGWNEVQVVRVVGTGGPSVDPAATTARLRTWVATLPSGSYCQVGKQLDTDHMLAPLRAMPGARLHKEFESVIDQMIDEAGAAGLRMTLTSAGDGYRTCTQQAGSTTGQATKPGYSLHNLGLAVDISCNGGAISRSSPCFKWIDANKARFGLMNYEKEPWHWSVNGK